MRKLNPSEPNVSANAAPSARKARTKTSDKAGARAAKHSKAVVEEPVAAPSDGVPVVQEEAVAPEAPAAPVAAPEKTVTSEEIAKLAYSYWLERGCQGGSAHEDWIRAEQTLLAVN